MRVALPDRRFGSRWAVLRPITGADELTLDAATLGAGTRLLASLLTDVSDATVRPHTIGELDIADRDRLLAAVYTACFGDDVVGVAPCGTCGEEFEFHFALSSLTAHQAAFEMPPGVETTGEHGYYRLPRGPRFRLPTVADLDAVAAQEPEQAAAGLLGRCVDGAIDDVDADAIQEIMEQLTPSLELDVAARCPHCDAAGAIAFSIETFLVSALARERRFLTLEVHRLALAYGWSLADILSLSRDDRRTLVRQVQLDGMAGRRR
jgi:hypothetical protein